MLVGYGCDFYGHEKTDEGRNRKILSKANPGIFPPLPFSAPQFSECFLYIPNGG
jgi:hypothetical protein